MSNLIIVQLQQFEISKEWGNCTISAIWNSLIPRESIIHLRVVSFKAIYNKPDFVAFF